MFAFLQQLPAVLNSGGGKAIFFFVYLVSAWVLMPLWAYSTWRSRGSVYVRVRQPVWLLADISLILLIMTVICVKEMKLSTDENLPCWQSNSAAALAVVWVPGVNLSRSSHLWYAFSIREAEKDDRVYLLHRFRTIVTGALAFMGLIAVIVVNSGLPLCFSTICRPGQCYWNGQFLLLMPVCGSLTLTSGLSWVRLFRTERFERLGLNAEFWRTNLIVVPLLLGADILTILMDAKVIQAKPHGHFIISTVWLVLPTSRFIVLHVLPSIAYGYSPLTAFPHWASQCRRLTGRRSRMVSPISPFSPVSPARFTIGMASSGATGQPLSPREHDHMSPRDVEAQHGAAAVAVEQDKGAHSPETVASPSSAASASPPASPARSPLPSSAPEPPLPMSLVDCSLDDLLSSGDEALIHELLAFCRSLLCDHWVQFLLTLHPYCSPAASPSSPADGPGAPMVPLKVVLAVYQVFLCPRAPLFVPVDGQVLHAVYNFCAPRLSEEAVGKANLLQSVNDHASAVRTLTATLKRHKTQGRGLDEEGDDTAAVMKLFKLAYLEVQRLVSHEAWPLFKAHMKARGPHSMELQPGGSLKGGNVSPVRPLDQSAGDTPP